MNAVLIDSNVFIRLLRVNRDPMRFLDPWKGDRYFMTCGMVRMEVERGIAKPAVQRRVAAFFDVMMCVPTSNQIWANATEIAWALDRRGKVLPAQDVLIAAHALKFGGAILTSDRHFYDIPGMRVYDPAEEFSDWDAGS
ncbi:MAG: PIN domain-containing protein [Verrucomicrobia bacterium]|nr:PIN domain-containing protein [Verrucomicrobiota bacterium]